jgi:cytoskeletal protein RodZ
MRKTYLITAILLLSAVWAAAQTTPQSTNPGGSTAPQTSPSSTSPSQQPATSDTSSTTQTTTTQTTQTSTESNAIEGCLSGSAGNFTLTDQSGKTWQLAGDTAKLGDHVGHQVRISGSEAGGASTPGAPAGAGTGASSGAQPTFTVKNVKMISSSCPTSK